MADQVGPVHRGVPPARHDPKNREREAKRAEQLRENLLKRKRQQRERAAEQDQDDDQPDHGGISGPSTGGLTDIEV